MKKGLSKRIIASTVDKELDSLTQDTIATRYYEMDQITKHFLLGA